MSYDIFCYKSELGIPDENEADKVIEADNDKWIKKEQNAETKLAIVKALTKFNPRLEAFDFDYGEIAKLTQATIEEAKSKFDHIELNPHEGDIAIQLTIFSNHVFITVPYWYQGDQAKQVLTNIRDYIKVIRDTAGYFVYDPQTGEVFDPAEDNFNGSDQYLSGSKNLDEIINPNQTPKEIKKPWWKFW